MLLTNNSQADRGFAVKGAAPFMCHPGETLDMDFDLDHPVMAAWLADGSITQGEAKPAADLLPSAGYAISHTAFGNYTVVDKDGVAVKDSEGGDLVFKAADGDAKVKAQDYADRMNKLNAPAA